MRIHIKLEGNKKWFSVNIKQDKITKQELFINYLDYVDLEDWYVEIDGEKTAHSESYENSTEDLMINDWDYGRINE